MLCNPGNIFTVLFFLIALFTNTARGQSLAIHRNSKLDTRIEADSPTGIGYRLQASTEFQDWVDVSDQASGPLSYRLDNTGVTNRFFRLRTWNIGDDPITIVLIGDSTVADFAVNLNWFSGWGQGIYGYLKPNVRVVNLAVAGTSTKSFLTSTEMQKMMIIKPDFVLVQFGSVDTFYSGDPSRMTTLAEYQANLQKIIQAIRDFSGTPILVTPVNTRIFNGANKVLPAFQDRCEIVKQMAATLQTYLIDLNQLSQNLFNELGESKSAYISWSDTDRAHFSLDGATVIAGLVVNAFPNILRPQVVESASGQPPAKP